MKTGWAIGFAIVGSFLAAGLLILLSRPVRGQPVTLQAAPTPLPLVVHVTGSVHSPGVLSLPAGSRLQDAIEAAGGLKSEADTQALNLAAFLEDGQRVHIPSQASADPVDEEPASRSQSLELPEPGTPTATGPVNINSATQDELETLPGIGPTIAQRIILYRETNGAFTSIEDIQKVEGIGQKKFEAIMYLITVEGP
jgi:competence protein ComEA